MNIFGSDGFRCKFGTSFMTFNFITKFSEALADTYHKEQYSKPIIIGRDTRSSGVLLENLITSILLANGINTILADIIPTPGLSKLLDSGDYSLGIMITASHNPHEDNGIKLFSSSGFKLPSETESRIETFILNDNENLDIFSSSSIAGKKLLLDNPFKEYIESILKSSANTQLNKKILIDCSNGAYSNLSKFFKDRDDLTFINNTPSGNNINLNCGALHADELHMIIKKEDHDFGIAFDGDGDRAVFVSKEYGVIEVEKLVFLFYKLLHKGKSAKVVISEVSNLALRHNLENSGGTLIETEVGDRFVVNSVKENNALFGCEPSGHFYFPGHSKSMDGFVAMQIFLSLLDSHSENIDDQLRSLKHYNRIQENINIKDYPNLDLQITRNTIKQLINNKEEKLIIRQSMWDPVIRIYYDYSKENNFLFIKENIMKALSNAK